MICGQLTKLREERWNLCKQTSDRSQVALELFQHRSRRLRHPGTLNRLNKNVDAALHRSLSIKMIRTKPSHRLKSSTYHEWNMTVHICSKFCSNTSRDLGQAAGCSDAGLVCAGVDVVDSRASLIETDRSTKQFDIQMKEHIPVRISAVDFCHHTLHTS